MCNDVPSLSVCVCHTVSISLQPLDSSFTFSTRSSTHPFRFSRQSLSHQFLDQFSIIQHTRHDAYSPSRALIYTKFYSLCIYIRAVLLVHGSQGAFAVVKFHFLQLRSTMYATQSSNTTQMSRSLFTPFSIFRLTSRGKCNTAYVIYSF